MSPDRDHDAGTCETLESATISHESLVGSEGGCANVPRSAVFRDPYELSDHVEDYCQSVKCGMELTCPPAPEVDFDQWMIAYVSSTASACDASLTIDRVQRCDQIVEVHYTLVPEGPCTAIAEAWNAVKIPKTIKNVVFIEKIEPAG